jgi:hypothetical protein
VYQGLATLRPDAFAGAVDSDKGIARWVYFSFVALTTIGFGDITPVARGTLAGDARSAHPPALSGHHPGPAALAADQRALLIRWPSLSVRFAVSEALPAVGLQRADRRLFDLDPIG